MQIIRSEQYEIEKISDRFYRAGHKIGFLVTEQEAAIVRSETRLCGTRMASVGGNFKLGTPECKLHLISELKYHLDDDEYCAFLLGDSDGDLNLYFNPKKLLSGEPMQVAFDDTVAAHLDRYFVLSATVQLENAD